MGMHPYTQMRYLMDKYTPQLEFGNVVGVHGCMGVWVYGCMGALQLTRTLTSLLTLADPDPKPNRLPDP